MLQVTFPENTLYFKEADEKVACDQVISNVSSENKYTTMESKMQNLFLPISNFGVFAVAAHTSISSLHLQIIKSKLHHLASK